MRNENKTCRDAKTDAKIRSFEANFWREIQIVSFNWQNIQNVIEARKSKREFFVAI